MTSAVTARPDTAEMVFVHNSFRQQFGALPGLVRTVPPGDVARASVVVEFLAELTTALHHHHEGEDELMWPLLLERAPLDSALILTVEEQHERIAELYQRAADNAAKFVRTADTDTGVELADTLTELNAALTEHLHDEELHILPLVEQVMTVTQWEALGERGRAGIPKDRQLVFLGFLLDANTPERGREFLRSMPAPARIAWKLMGRRAFAREYRRIYGTNPTSPADSLGR
jgi:hemerythrin-like domain-containing protein